MTASIGSRALMGMGTSTPVTQAIEFVSESIRAQKTILETGGIRGTRSHPRQRTRQGTYTVSGSVVMYPAPDETIFLLPFIMGGTFSSNTIGLAETISDLAVTVDRVAKVFSYPVCKASRATFAASQGQLMQLTLDVEGKTETVGNAGTFPSLSNLTTEQPWIFFDAILTYNSVAYSLFDFTLSIDNMPLRDRFTNSQTQIGRAHV